MTFTPPQNLNLETYEELIAVNDDGPVTGKLIDSEIVHIMMERKGPRIEVEEENID